MKKNFEDLVTFARGGREFFSAALELAEALTDKEGELRVLGLKKKEAEDEISRLKKEIAELTDRWGHLTGQVERFQVKAKEFEAKAEQAERYYAQVKGKILESIGKS